MKNIVKKIIVVSVLMMSVLLGVFIFAQTNSAQTPDTSKKPLDFSFDNLSDAKTESEIKTVLDKFAKLIKENPSEVSDIYLERASFFSKLIEHNKVVADLVRYTNSLADYDFLTDQIVALKFKTLGNYSTSAGIKLLSKNPSAQEFARTYLERALARAQMPEMVDYAFKDATEALTRNPALTAAHLIRAKILVEKRNTDEGIAEANVALAQDADNVGALSIRAVGYAIKNDFSHSLDDLNRATALDPELASLYNAFGVRYQIYTALGKTDLAAADLQKAQKLANIVSHILQMK